jgi:hypothetical protein
MDYLTEFDLKISLVDGMLIETGGKHSLFLYRTIRRRDYVEIL